LEHNAQPETGIATPLIVEALRQWSSQVFLRKAAMIPIGIPSKMDMAKAAPISLTSGANASLVRP
jgi:hypothetical protein